MTKSYNFNSSSVHQIKNSTIQVKLTKGDTQTIINKKIDKG